MTIKTWREEILERRGYCKIVIEFIKQKFNQEDQIEDFFYKGDIYTSLYNYIMFKCGSVKYNTISMLEAMKDREHVLCNCEFTGKVYAINEQLEYFKTEEKDDDYIIKEKLGDI